METDQIEQQKRKEKKTTKRESMVYGNSVTASAWLHSHYRDPSKRRERREKKTYRAENFFNLGREHISRSIQKAQKTPNKMNSRRAISRQ